MIYYRTGTRLTSLLQFLFPLCFKMAERLENFNNVLRDWAKDKEEKCLAAALKRFEKQVAKR